MLQTKIQKRSWVLHECAERVPENIDAMRELLQYGLRGTDLEALITIGEGNDHGRLAECVHTSYCIFFTSVIKILPRMAGSLLYNKMGNFREFYHLKNVKSIRFDGWKLRLNNLTGKGLKWQIGSHLSSKHRPSDLVCAIACAHHNAHAHKARCTKYCTPQFVLYF